MHSEWGWAMAAGAAVGVFGWILGLGNVLWPHHPQLALLFIVVAVTLVSMPVLRWNDRPRTNQVQH